MSGLRVIVCGSRSAWDDRPAFEAFLASMDEIYAKSMDLTIVHGDCMESPDQWAREYADEWILNEEPHPAEWDKHGKAAGFIRNAEMADLGADLCIAVWDGFSKGTRHMILEAIRSGITTTIIPCRNTEK